MPNRSSLENIRRIVCKMEQISLSIQETYTVRFSPWRGVIIDPRFPRIPARSRSRSNDGLALIVAVLCQPKNIAAAGFSPFSCESCGPKEASTMAQLAHLALAQPRFCLHPAFRILLPFWPMPALGAELFGARAKASLLFAGDPADSGLLSSERPARVTVVSIVGKEATITLLSPEIRRRRVVATVRW